MINISKLYSGLKGESDALRYSKRPQKPIAVFNSTAKCNLKCIHCYSRSTNCSGEYELSTVESKNLISQVAEYGCPVILFSGGEPLLRGDLFELIAYAADMKLRTVISTNGTLITKEKAERLKELGVSYVGVSLDGPGQVHDLFRAVKGAFAAAMQGVANCHGAGLRTGLRFTITPQNHLYAGSIFQIARDSGTRRICFYHLVRTGRAQEMLEPYLDPKSVRDTLDAIITETDKAVKAGQVDEVLTVGNHADGPYLLMRMKREEHSGYESAKELLRINGGNKSGQNIACISWDGTVFADQFWRNYRLGNVRQKSFGEIWDNPDEPVLKMLRDKKIYAHSRCKACRFFDICGGNYRFTGEDATIENWCLEPPCYMNDEEICSEAMR